MSYYEKYKEKHNQHNKEVYEWRKAHKMCTRCGREKAAEGVLVCDNCRVIKQKECLKYYYDNHEERKKRMLETQRNLRNERKAKGLCIRCGKPTDGMTMCDEHREIMKKYQKEYRRRKFLKELAEGRVNND